MGKLAGNYRFDRGVRCSGAPFKISFEMREPIAEHKDDIACGFTPALIDYGLGRPYGFTDRKLAERILIQAQDRDHAFRFFIRSVVQSKVFLGT